MKGLDHAWADPEPQGLARQLLEQAHAQGKVLTPREAVLAAQLVELESSPVSMGTPAKRLSPTEVNAFFKWPALTPTPEEEAARRISWKNPQRWGRAVLNASFGGLMVWGSYRIFVANAHGTPGPVLASFALGSTMIMLFGVLMVVSGVVNAFTGSDTSMYDRRQLETFRASLRSLSRQAFDQLYDAANQEILLARANRVLPDVATMEELRAEKRRREAGEQ